MHWITLKSHTCQVCEMVKRRPTEYPTFVPRNTGDWLLWGAYAFVHSFETAVEGIRGSAFG
jgi:hypothetical protein